MSAKKILVLVGDFVEDYEVMIPYQALSMLGHIVHVVCPDKKAGESIRTAIHEFEGDQTYTEKPGHKFELNATFSEVKSADYHALIVPGGRAPEYLRLKKPVLNLVRQFDEMKKPIVAICHGVQILTAAGVLNGKRCTAYEVCEPEVTAAGGTWVTMPVDQAFVDGHLVSTPAWPGVGASLTKLLTLLGTKVEL